MAENQRENAEFAVNWGAVGRAYVELMDDVMPYLSPAEQLTYQRLFRLSHVQGGGFATCRYSELAGQCGLSVSTLQRALRGLRAKQLVTTGWQSHGATTFEVQLLSTLPQRPAFLPRRPRPARNASARPLSRPRDWVGWTNEPQTDRELERLRRSVARGQPYGSEAWVQRMTRRLSLEGTLRPRGRPKLSTRKGS